MLFHSLGMSIPHTGFQSSVVGLKLDYDDNSFQKETNQLVKPMLRIGLENSTTTPIND